MPADPIRVLFVCTHNSARSQIAEALLKRYGGTDFEVYSAGTEVTRVNPFALQVIEEAGIDWSGARSKSITEFLDQQFDYVITVCDRARATCPVFPGSTNTLHWGLDDPSEVEGTDAGEAGRLPPHGGRRVRPTPAVHRGRAPRSRSTAPSGSRLKARGRRSGGDRLVGEAGLEPAISCSQSTCVTRLRYSPPDSCSGTTCAS